MTRAEARARLALRIPREDAVVPATQDIWLDAGLLDLATRRVEIDELQLTEAFTNSTIGVHNYTIPATLFALRYLEDATNRRMLTPFSDGYEGFLRAKQSAAGNGKPTHFAQWGGNFYVFPAPDSVVSFTPHGYRKPLWVSSSGSSPNISNEWDRGILLAAEVIAYQDLGDEERAAVADQQLGGWLASRDTATRQRRRYSSLTRGAQPMHATRRDPRTGV